MATYARAHTVHRPAPPFMYTVSRLPGRSSSLTVRGQVGDREWARQLLREADAHDSGVRPLPQDQIDSFVAVVPR
jgi:hypothetical protein